jgi:homoserine dehydrogenase
MSIDEHTPRIVVLKFGSSVLRTAADLPPAVSEIYRHYRQGEQVVAVVSAFAGVTDRLLADVPEWVAAPGGHAVAARVATGEIDSATQLVFALERAGIPATFIDPRDVNLTARGDRLNAELVSVGVGRLQQLLGQSPVIVLPGFYGLSEDHGIALLGRGGSDLTATYLAQQLGAHCVLVKDVDGLYEADPAQAWTRPRRYETAHYDEALRVGGELVQAKAIECARAKSQRIEIRTLGERAGTMIGPDASGLVPSREPERLKITLLGLGTVGRGVYEYLAAQPERFEIVAILVRNPRRHQAASIPAKLLVTDPVLALSWSLSRQADAVVEVLGGLDPAYRMVMGALAAGRAVVSANKELIATHWENLSTYMTGNTPRLRCSAAVGGAVPMMELVQRLAIRRGIREIRGIVNGTCNCVLEQVTAGVSLEEAVRRAQALGYAEPDPSADLDGIDAARKIDLLCRLAWGLPPARLQVEGIRSVDPRLLSAANAVGGTCRLVASIGEDRIARVAPTVLPHLDFLAHASGAENRLEVTTRDGVVHRIAGQGAGRWPTATAILADLLDVALMRADHA